MLRSGFQRSDLAIGGTASAGLFFAGRRISRPAIATMATQDAGYPSSNGGVTNE